MWSNPTTSGTVDRIQHDAEPVTTVGGYVASKMVGTASTVFGKTLQVAENVLPANTIPAGMTHKVLSCGIVSYDSL